MNQSEWALDDDPAADDATRAARPRSRQVPLGLRIVAALNGILAAAFILAGLLVLFVAVEATTGGVIGDALTGFQLPVVIAASLVALGAVVYVTARDLWAGTEDGRRSTLGLATIAILAFYLELNVGSIVVSGELIANRATTLAVGLAIAAVYSIPIILYLRRAEVRAFTRGVPVEEVAPGAAPGEGRPAGGSGWASGSDRTGQGRPLTGEVVSGGRTLRPDVIVGRPIRGGAVPAGAVSRTTCSTCSTPLAVTTAQRPVVVECPQCGTHGRLGGRRPGEWPAHR